MVLILTLLHTDVLVLILTLLQNQLFCFLYEHGYTVRIFVSDVNSVTQSEVFLYKLCYTVVCAGFETTTVHTRFFCF